MISQGKRGWNIKTFEPMWKSQMSKGKPIKWSTTLFVFYAQSSKWVKEIITLGWEGYGGQIRIWEVIHFWKSLF